MYLAYALFTGLIGLAFSVLLRLELSSPGNQYLSGQHHIYNVVVTTHGIVIIYFVVVPSIAGFANYIAPVLIGSPDAISIRMNLCSLTSQHTLLVSSTEVKP